MEKSGKQAERNDVASTTTVMVIQTRNVISRKISVDLRSTLMGTKNLNENGPNPLLLLLLNLIRTRFVQIRLKKSARAFRNKIANGFGRQICLHQRYKTANWISHAAQLLLNLANNAARTQIHNNLCQERGGYRQGYGRLEVGSSLKRRERTLAVWSEVLEILGDKRINGLRGLRRIPPKSSGCGACIPELTTRRHGRRLCLGSQPKTTTLQGRYRRFVGDAAFHTTSFRGAPLLVGGDGDGDGAGTRTGGQASKRTQNRNGNGSRDGNESSSGDRNGDRNEDGIGEGKGEAKKRKKRHKSCRRDVGNGGDLGATRKKRRQDNVGAVATDPDNLKNSKEARRGAQGTKGLIVRIVQVERVCPLCRV